MLVYWEIPLSVIADNFKYDHKLEGEVVAIGSDYDAVGEAILIEFEIDPEDFERIPESDTDGNMIST